VNRWGTKKGSPKTQQEKEAIGMDNASGFRKPNEPGMTTQAAIKGEKDRPKEREKKENTGERRRLGRGMQTKSGKVCNRDLVCGSSFPEKEKG